MEEGVKYLEPIITERQLWNLHNLLYAIIIATISIMIFIVVLFLTNIDLVWALILLISIVVIDAIILFFLLEPHVLREVTQEIIKTQEKTIETPIYRQIPIETEKRIYILSEKPPKEQFNFYASSNSRTYHKSSCRLSRLIKDEYRVGKNSIEYFKKQKYKPCKICIQHKFGQLA